MKWGDFDQHDNDTYSKFKFFEYSNDNNYLYQSKTRIIITIDLAYNIYSTYGYLIEIVRKSMNKIMKLNFVLFVLRIRKALQLYSSELVEPFFNLSNYSIIYLKIK